MNRNETKKQIAIEALASGNTLDEAGKIAEVARSTISRWSRQPEFLQAVRDRNSEKIQRLSLRILDISMLALDRLEGIIKDSRNERTVMSAITVSLSRMVNIMEFTQFEDRLKRLESQVGMKDE